MNFPKTYLSLIIGTAIAAGVLVACSSSDSDTSTNKANSRVTSGVITGFGSVFVGGVEYQTTNTAVNVNGVGASENDLALGMVVNVKGSVNADGTTGTATQIDYSDEANGSVMAVNLNNGLGTINVMGMTVNVDAATVFKSDVAGITTIDMLQIGNIVEVSGYSDGSGTIYATRIEVKKASHTDGEEIEVKGRISNLDTTSMTFELGDPNASFIIVDYSTARLENFPASGIANDQFVEVVSTSEIAGNVLAATKVVLQNVDNKHVETHAGDHLELEGVVTADLTNNQFKLNDQTVIVDPETTHVVNGALTDIVIGVKLEVEGQMDSDGNLVASNIIFREQASAKMFAQVDAVSADTNSVSVMGVEIHVNTLTHMADEQTANNMMPVRHFNLTEVSVGDWIEVRYYQDTSGSFVATELKRENAPANSVDSLHGTIDIVLESGFLVVAGVTVDASVSTAVFTVGQTVEITGNYSAGTLVAIKITTNH